MKPDRWNRIKALFAEAQAYPGAGRHEFLRAACDTDQMLLSEVEKLLDSDERAGSFLENSAADDLVSLFEPDELAELVEQRAEGVKRRLPRFARGMVLNGRYEIVRMLGKGGMGEVYLAKDNRINRSVALKVINSDLAASTDTLERFALEAQTVSALNHPHIMTIYEYDHTEDGALFFVAEFVDGETLNHLIGDGLELTTVLDIGKQVLAALSAAHQAGIVHRDIKPENIMVRRDGYIKVLDFGLAKIPQKEFVSVGSGSEDPTVEIRRTRPGAVVGTPAYMSPEQARGKQLDGRTDIWSFGVVLYEMICGRRPFAGDNTADILVSVLSKKPPRISAYRKNIPAALETIIERALAKEADARYQNCDELRREFEEIANEVSLGRSEAGTGGNEGREPKEGRAVRETAGHAVRKTQGDRQAAVDDSVLSAPEPVAPAPAPRQTLFRFAALAAAAVLAVFALAYFVLRSPTGVGPIDSVAVLPFENPGGSPDLAYVSDGFSETLIDRLSQIAELRVVSRSSSSQFRGPGVDPAEAAAKLGVGAVITGSVSLEGEEIVIRIDVVDTGDRQLMGSSFRRKAADIAGLQREIAESVAASLRLKLSDSQRNRLVRHATDDSEAFRHYLNGLVAFHSTQDGRKSNALELFERAVELDPQFGEAHAEIAYIYWLIANNTDEPHRLMQKAKVAAEQAMAADPGLAKAHTAAAILHEYELDWAAAESAYQRSIELNPNLDLTRNNYAFFLSVMGRHDEALAQLGEQTRRDPLNRRLALIHKGIMLTQARRYDDALETFREAQAIEPDREIPNFALGYAYAGKGLINEAERYYRRSIELMGGEGKYSQPLIYLAALQAQDPEKRGDAFETIRRIEGSGQYTSPAIMAVAYVALGDKDKAIGLLEEAYIKRDPLLRFIGTGYEYDSLHDDPRFEDLLKRIGMQIH